MNATSLVPDDLWEAIGPLLPKEPPKPKGGRPRNPDRAALGGIIFVLRTGCPWRLLPKELGCGSGTTCWRRLRDWQQASAWQRLHETLLNWLGDEAAIDWSRVSLDSLSVRAKRGASRPARTPSTGASLAPSTTWLSIATASRWRSASQPPMPTTLRSCSRWSTTFPRSSDLAGDRAGRASDRPNSTPIRPTIPRTSAVPCALVALRRGLRDVGSTPPNDSDDTAGWWSARWPGCWVAAASVCATNGGPICSRACSTWAVRCSASRSSFRRARETQGAWLALALLLSSCT